MKIRGVLFDKDGTLIDFYSLWLTTTEKVMPMFLRANGLPADEETVRCVMEAVGVKGGTVDPNGAIAYKPYMGIAEDMKDALTEAETGEMLTAQKSADKFKRCLIQY